MSAPQKTLIRAKYRPKAATISDDDIRALAPEIIVRQERGYINSRELAAKLNEDRVTHPRGRHWTHSAVFLIMERGVRLGLDFIRRGRSEAGSYRKVLRRSKDVIQAERATSFAAAVKKLTNPAIIAAVTASDRGAGQ